MCVCAFSYLLKLNVWRLSHPVMHPKQPFKVSILSHDHWWVGAQQHVLRLASVPICSWDCLFKLLPTFYLRYQWLVEHLTVSRTPNLPIHVSRITCLTHFLGVSTFDFRAINWVPSSNPSSPCSPRRFFNTSMGMAPPSSSSFTVPRVLRYGAVLQRV